MIMNVTVMQLKSMNANTKIQKTEIQKRKRKKETKERNKERNKETKKAIYAPIVHKYITCILHTERNSTGLAENPAEGAYRGSSLEKEGWGIYI